LLLYLKKISSNNWKVSHQPLKKLVKLGWSVQALIEMLTQQPNCDIFSLGRHADADVVLSGTGVLANNDLPVFSVEEMQRQIVKFVVADDQVSIPLLSACYY
jgi:hypothetical protein